MISSEIAMALSSWLSPTSTSSCSNSFRLATGWNGFALPFRAARHRASERPRGARDRLRVSFDVIPNRVEELDASVPEKDSMVNFLGMWRTASSSVSMGSRLAHAVTWDATRS